MIRKLFNFFSDVQIFYFWILMVLAFNFAFEFFDYNETLFIALLFSLVLLTIILYLRYLYFRNLRLNLDNFEILFYKRKLLIYKYNFFFLKLLFFYLLFFFKTRLLLINLKFEKLCFKNLSKFKNYYYIYIYIYLIYQNILNIFYFSEKNLIFISWFNSIKIAHLKNNS